MARKQADRWYEYFREQQHKLEAAGDILTSQENTADSALLNQLFITAAGIITLASALLLQDSAVKKWPEYVLVGLLMAIVTAAYSIGCGVAQLHINRKFFEDHKDMNVRMVKAISRGEVKEYSQLQELFAEEEKYPVKSSRLFGQFQLWCLYVSGTAVLFSTCYIVMARSL